MQLHALFRLAFATTPHQKCLILLHRVSHRLIMQKARGHACHLRDLALPQIVGFTVSGTFHFPSGGTFHHFLHSTLYTIGCQGVFSLRRWSSWIPTGFAPYPVVLGYPSEMRHNFRSRDFYPLWLFFPESLN